MQHILVYADSLSWGIVPTTRQRLPFDQRWPGVMENLLNQSATSVRVIEDCLNGRRTVWDDPFKPGRNGLVGLAQRIEIHSPLALVVLFGFFPELRKLPGAKSPLGMPIVIEIVMMAVAAIMLMATRVNVDDVPKTATLRAGVVAVIGIFGLAWLGDSFIAAHKDVIVPAIGHWAEVAPWTFALGLFFASVLLYSQAATTRALMPLGIALGIPPQFLIAMFPSVNGYFFIPTYGSLIAAINFDLAGTTKIGKYVLNHSFMIPGVVATGVAVTTGLLLARVLF